MSSLPDNVMEARGARGDGTYLSDKDVICGASARLALYGIKIGLGSEVIGSKPPKQLLEEPNKCRLVGPSLTKSHKSFELESENASSRYRAAVESCGSTLAASLEVSGWGAHLNANVSKSNKASSESKSSLQQNSTEMLRITRSLVPIKAFCIAEPEVVLSDQAVKAIKRIYNKQQAKEFLVDFGSHVPCGEQHLGGIMWTTEKKTSSKATHEHSSEDSHSSDLSLAGSVGGGVGPFQGKASASYDKKKSNTSSASHHSNDSTSSRHVTIEFAGPHAAGFDDFVAAVTSSPESWYLMDRGPSEGMIPVWHFVTDNLVGEATAARVASLLLSVWSEQANRFANIDLIKWLIDRSSNDAASTIGVKIHSHLDRLSMINVKTTAPQDLDKLVRELLSMIDKIESDFGTFILADLLRDDRLPRVLGYFASQSANPRVQSVLEILGNYFNPEMRTKLRQGNPSITLDRHVQSELSKAAARRQSRAHESRPTPVSLHEIPAAIVAIVAIADGKDAGREMMQRLGDFWAVTMENLDKGEMPDYDRTNLHRIKELASNFWIPDKRKFTSSLSAPQVRLFARGIEIILAMKPQSGMTTHGRDDDIWRRPFSATADTGNVRSISHVQTSRTVSSMTSELDTLLHTLVHRLDVREALYPGMVVNADDDSDYADDDSDYAASSDEDGDSARNDASSRVDRARTIIVQSGYDTALNLLSSLDVAARAAVMKLLLDRRFLVPLVSPNPVGGDTFHWDVDPLVLVDTFVGIDYGDVNLLSNTNLLRVVVMSMKSKKSSKAFKWVDQIFNVHSFHAMDKNEEAALSEADATAELGWGFYRDRASDASGTKYIPVMLLHVIGDHHRLRAFIEAFADVVIVELEHERSSCDITVADGWVIQYVQSDKDIFKARKGTPNIRNVLCEFDSSASRIMVQLYKYLTKMESETSGQHARRKLLGGVLCGSEGRSEYQPADTKHHRLDTLPQIVDFRTVRFTLKMQLEFAEYAQERLQHLREAERDPVSRALLSVEKEFYEWYQAERLLSKSANHPLIMMLVDLLSLPSAGDRVAGVMHLERLLHEKCKPHLDDAKAQERQVWIRKGEQLQPTPHVIEQWKRCVEKTNMSSVGLVHLWRELSHVYAASPAKRSMLANLATQHLLDGFPLELMDGDAGAINLVWIEGVLKALSAVLGSAKILVLSILGVQSSGKSTLFNVMFGVRLQTGAGRCTRGVSMQLIKCEGHDNYEYILLLDTEGVRSPDFIGMEGSVWRDNRMATLAIVPADATIVLTKGESTKDINDMLPIMLTAYKRSDLAKEHNCILPSKLVFVFNQNTTNQVTNLTNIANTLRTELNSNAERVDQILAGTHIADDTQRHEPSSPKPRATTSRAFSDVRVDMNNMDQSDMRVLGTLAGTDSPPMDTPNAAFGSDVLRLRDYVHSRVVNDDWVPRTMGKFAKMFTSLNECIEQSDFDFSFTAAIERVNYDQLVHQIDVYTHELTNVYWTKFGAIATEITVLADKNAQDEPNADTDKRVKEVTREFSLRLGAEMGSDIRRLNEAVETLKRDRKYQKWSSSYVRPRWDRYTTEQDTHWKQQVCDCVKVKFKYNTVVEKYKREFRRKTNDLFCDGKWRKFNENRKHEAFERIFGDLVQEARREHEPYHLKVSALVMEVLETNQDVRTAMQAFEANSASNGFTDKAVDKAVEFAKWAFGYGQKRDVTADLVEMILRRVDSEIDNAQVYRDETVQKCIKIAQDAFNQHPVKIKAQVRGMLYHRMCEKLQRKLQEKQRVWEMDNNIASRFEATRDQMRDYFDLLGEGCKGMEAFQKGIVKWLRKGLSDAFVEELVKFIGDKAKGDRWVLSAKVLQALLDNDLVQELRNNRIETAIECLRNPRDHTSEVLKRLIANQVEIHVAEQLEVFRSKICDAIILASSSTSVANCDYATVFTTHLLEQLRALPTGATNSLADSMPDLSSPAFRFDEQPNEVFVQSDKNYVCKPMVDAVSEEFQSMTRERGDLCSVVPPKVLKYFDEVLYGATYGARPRCGEPCPLCSCPCTREYGHVSKEEQARHDTIHQPIGLTGGYLVGSSELFARNCCDAAEGYRFLYDDKWHDYKDFDKVFTSWSMPIASEPLKLREYIFYKYQPQLVAIFNKNRSKGEEPTKACSSLPQNYNHLLTDIETSIQRLIE